MLIRPLGRVLSGLTLLGLSLSSPLIGQTAAPLGTGQAAAPEFGRIAGVRELADGSVLVSDQLGQALVRLSFDGQRADTLGAIGRGPGEYLQPRALFALPEGASLMMDISNARMLRIEADGTLGETYPLAFEGRIAFVQAVDDEGRIYFERISRTEDVASVVRATPGGTTLDTVATVRRPRPEDTGRTIRPRAFDAQDRWSVTGAGDVAIARGHPYRLDWRGDDGRLNGPEVEWESRRVTDRERDAFRERLVSTAVAMDASPSGGASGPASVSLAQIRQAFPDDAFPDRLPPFLAVLATPWDEVWVERVLPVEALPRYDVFDQSSRRVRSLELRAGERIVGFGPQTIYTAIADDYGLERLVRYARAAF